MLNCICLSIFVASSRIQLCHYTKCIFAHFIFACLSGNHFCSDCVMLTPSTPAIPNWCHSKGPVPYWSNPPFLISDILGLWRSVLSAGAPECQKLKMVGYTSMAKCRALTGSAVKGLIVCVIAVIIIIVIGSYCPESGDRSL